VSDTEFKSQIRRKATLFDSFFWSDSRAPPVILYPRQRSSL
jgi:hypothetical protein